MTNDEGLFWRLYRKERKKLVPSFKTPLSAAQIVHAAREARKRMSQPPMPRPPGGAGEAELTEELFEFTVLSWSPGEGVRFAGPGLGASWTTDEARVRAHYAYMTGPWRARLKEEAAENEASGFEGGNWAYMTWNNKRDGKKHLRFAIARRPAAAKGEVIESEDGFQT